jgi:adenylate cyclase
MTIVMSSGANDLLNQGWGAAYLIVAWLIAQIISVLNEPLSLPEWFDPVVLLLLAFGFPIGLVLAWAYELTPEGIKLTIDDSQDKEVSGTRGQRLNRVVTVLLVSTVAFLGFASGASGHFVIISDAI